MIIFAIHLLLFAPSLSGSYLLCEQFRPESCSPVEATTGPGPWLTHALPLSESATEDDVVYITDSGYAEFTSRVPLHTFTGESNHLTGMIDLEENIIDFYLDLNTLETGIDRRDRDMFRTLNIEEYTFAEFTGSLESSFDRNSDVEQSVVAVGEFTIHGVTREVRIEGSLQKLLGGLQLEAEWIINIEDHDIEPPGILFYRVSDEQEVRIEATLEERERDEVLDGN